MANGFVHKDNILSLKEHFVQYFNKKLESNLLKVEWIFPEKDLEHAYILGKRNEEVKIMKTLFIVRKGGLALKKIRISLIEDKMETLTVKINEKIACSIEPRGRINEQFLKSLAQSIKGAI
jgi:hypothetical protein